VLPLVRVRSDHDHLQHPFVDDYERMPDGHTSVGAMPRS